MVQVKSSLLLCVLVLVATSTVSATAITTGSRPVVLPIRVLSATPTAPAAPAPPAAAIAPATPASDNSATRVGASVGAAIINKLLPSASNNAPQDPEAALLAAVLFSDIGAGVGAGIGAGVGNKIASKIGEVINEKVLPKVGATGNTQIQGLVTGLSNGIGAGVGAGVGAGIGASVGGVLANKVVPGAAGAPPIDMSAAIAKGASLGAAGVAQGGDVNANAVGTKLGAGVGGMIGNFANKKITAAVNKRSSNATVSKPSTPPGVGRTPVPVLGTAQATLAAISKAVKAKVVVKPSTKPSTKPASSSPAPSTTAPTKQTKRE